MLVLAPLPPSADEDTVSSLVQSFTENHLASTPLIGIGPTRQYPVGIRVFVEPWRSYNLALRQLLRWSVEYYTKEVLYTFSGPGVRFTKPSWEYEVDRIIESLPDHVYVISGDSGNIVLNRRFLSDMGGIPDVDSEKQFSEWARDMGTERKRLFSIRF